MYVWLLQEYVLVEQCSTKDRAGVIWGWVNKFGLQNWNNMLSVLDTVARRFPVLIGWDVRSIKAASLEAAVTIMGMAFSTMHLSTGDPTCCFRPMDRTETAFLKRGCGSINSWRIWSCLSLKWSDYLLKIGGWYVSADAYRVTPHPDSLGAKCNAQLS
jgi:hypothetical protein